MVKFPVEITDAMVYAGVDCIAEYEMGATSASEFVKAVFSSMLSASSICPALDPKDVQPEEIALSGSPH